MKALACPNCGAALPARALKNDLVACEYCGTTFRAPKTATPEPDMGDLILGADFTNEALPGWEIVHDGDISFHKGHPPELRGRYKPRLNSYYVLISSGFLDDFDASVSIKFTEGDEKLITAGFYPRMTNDGGYAVYISPLGSYSIGYFTTQPNSADLKWNTLVDWTSHASLRKGRDVPNRLRVIMDGEKMRVYLNGVLATSLKDNRYKMGKLRLVAEPNGETNLGVAYSDLQVREVVR
ncbi:MAG: hypothetical protein KPEEDBHJ_01496 [Anaerolineales bacterium]|nr:hypothetical protein [Anaerolineales bacterium]